MADALTVEQIRQLPAAVDLVTAGQALGLGRTKSHELARSGDWPTPLLRLGTRYRVRRSDLLELLGIEDAGARANGAPHKPHESNGAGPRAGPAHAITEIPTATKRPESTHDSTGH